MREQDKKRIYEAARRVCLEAVDGFDAEIDEDNIEKIVDEELITVIDEINNSAEEPPISREDKKQHTRDRIGQRIMALRKMAWLTQEQLSERAGLQRSHISKIEAGKYAVTFETIQAIAEALGMTVDIIDLALQDLAPMKKLTEPMTGSLGTALNKKVTEVFTPKGTE